nr:outer membrane protein assembly factor BamD [uncultured Desulfobulbus sp.]
MPVSPRLHPSISRLALICLLFLALALSGCSTFSGMFSKFTFGEEDEPKSLPPETLITLGMDAYNVGDYSEAVKNFKLILDEHPFSAQAMLAELKAADAHYYNKEYAEAKVLYKGFEEHHPTNEAIPYVLFQLGMCDYNRSDRIDRDISGPKEAIKAFSRLINAYPQSPYAKEAKTKIHDCKEFLVNHEYMVAVFYVRTERYQQAQQRLKYLLAMYPDTSLTPKAKALLERLQAGDPPSWGMSRWLPEFMTKAPEDRLEEAKENESASKVKVSQQREEEQRGPDAKQ